jgi:hypothetical protein
MKSFTKIFASVVAILTLVVQTPVIQSAVTGFFTSHPTISTLVAGVGAILALFHNPAQQS